MRRVILSDHALDQLAERRLPAALAIDAVENLDEVVPSVDRLVAQKLVLIDGCEYLLRVVYEEHGSDAEVVTVYRASR